MGLVLLTELVKQTKQTMAEMVEEFRRQSSASSSDSDTWSRTPNIGAAPGVTGPDGAHFVLVAADISPGQAHELVGGGALVAWGCLRLWRLLRIRLA